MQQFSARLASSPTVSLCTKVHGASSHRLLLNCAFLFQGLGHLQQQDAPQQLHQPYRERPAAAGRGPGPDGGALPGEEDQTGAFLAAPHLREGRH